MKGRYVVICMAALSLATAAVVAAPTNNIMLTGYWPPTNEMLRQFSNNPEQNEEGWQGENWMGLGYDVYSFFPEFPQGLGKGEGDFEVDYQDTSNDWWAFTAAIQPIAIITFSRGSPGADWEVEWRQRNLASWINDYQAPFQPTPSPPDNSVPPGTIRYSSLPMQEIVDAVNDADLGLDAFIDWEDFGGGFLSEFIAYHGTWYHDLMADPDGPAWNVAAGHIHVAPEVTIEQGIAATEVTLQTLIEYVDTVVPEPGTMMLAGMAAAVFSRFTRRRRVKRGKLES